MITQEEIEIRDDRPVFHSDEWMAPLKHWNTPQVTRLAPVTVAKCGAAGLVCFGIVIVVIIVAFLVL